MLKALEIFLFAMALLLSGFFIWAAYTSKKENEPFAFRKFLNLGVLIFSISFLFIITHNILLISVLTGIFLLLGLVGIFLLFPFERKTDYQPQRPTSKIDERDTMFSRRELKPGSKEYDDFYEDNPKLKASDDNFRKLPGLLNPRSIQYNAFNFASANASFETIEALYNNVDGEVNRERVEADIEKISVYIKAWAKKLGALDSGVCLLKDYHVYSIGGRQERRNKKFAVTHNFAIAFTVEMDKQMVDTAPKAGIVMESGQQYLESGKISIQLASFIRKLGYNARAHIDGNYKVVCPLVARDAGLGEIGRMGLLMTPKYGPRVRIGVVTTDLPLLLDEPGDKFSVIDFCTICKKCADSCPSQAISFDDRIEINGLKRWQINQEACFTLWCNQGTDCGRCMSVCPYSHENNNLHDIVRTGIDNNYIFRRLALKMDDVFYGRRPVSKEIPEDLKI